MWVFLSISFCVPPPQKQGPHPLPLAVRVLTPAAVWEDSGANRRGLFQSPGVPVGEAGRDEKYPAVQHCHQVEAMPSPSLKTHSRSGHHAHRLHAEWVAFPGSWHRHLPGEAVPACQLTEHSSRCFSLPW